MAYWGERNQRDKGIVARIEQQIREAASQNIVKVNLKQSKKQVKSAAEMLAGIEDMEEDE